MSIWKCNDTIEDLKEKSKNTLVENIGIEYLEISENYIKARMPVDERTRQPYGILHGGASLAFAETLGSVAARLSIDNEQKRCVGIEINANHLRSVHEGFVYGTVKPINIGRTLHVWEITINDEENRLVCISRMTLSILDKK